VSGVYKVPQDGYYHVRSTVVRYERTGRMITVLDEDRPWWKFWAPKFVTVPEYRRVEAKEGTEVRFLKNGEEIDAPPVRIQ